MKTIIDLFIFLLNIKKIFIYISIMPRANKNHWVAKIGHVTQLSTNEKRRAVDKWMKIWKDAQNLWEITAVDARNILLKTRWISTKFKWLEDDKQTETITTFQGLIRRKVSSLNPEPNKDYNELRDIINFWSDVNWESCGWWPIQKYDSWGRAMTWLDSDKY